MLRVDVDGKATVLIHTKPLGRKIIMSSKKPVKNQTAASTTARTAHVNICKNKLSGNKVIFSERTKKLTAVPTISKINALSPILPFKSGVSLIAAVITKPAINVTTNTVAKTFP